MIGGKHRGVSLEVWSPSMKNSLSDRLNSGEWESSLVGCDGAVWNPLRPESALAGLEERVATEEAFLLRCVPEENSSGGHSEEFLLGLDRISPWNGRAQLFWWASRDQQQRKILAEPLKCLVQYAFLVLHLRRLSVLVESGPMETTIRSFGFAKEGTLREWAFVPGDGEYFDVGVFGCLRQECLVLNV
ncbi:hypothetical protein SAMN05920897_12110 [Alkalispirochaeta americana]|uniref:Protein N-acetyltransferase, RimJ/RimL family n=1 Tax=Alkalispirochaeta americana TaxID=159291 RepID=A0A1N6X813_9SPIO|nr:GNAT family protein [Alkalispirochaeta americana]SIQ98409.1 hypothetical protein SAMN05920897_12110 [Alkalispirochaeta americana]